MQTRLSQKLNVQANQSLVRGNRIYELDDGNFKIECLRCHLHLTVASELEKEQVLKEHAYLSCPQLELERRPTALQKVWNSCLLCNGDRKPVFKSMDDLKMHMLYAHFNFFFSLKIPNYSEPYACPYCQGAVQILDSWSETLVHVGIHHEKLYQALKHHRTQELSRLLKRLYPNKHKRHMSTH